MPHSIFMRKARFPSRKQNWNPKFENTSAKILQAHDTSNDLKCAFFLAKIYIYVNSATEICTFWTFCHPTEIRTILKFCDRIHAFSKKKQTSRLKFAYFHIFEKFRTEIGIFRSKSRCFLGEILLNFPQISTFSIKYSEAIVRDFDPNPCAYESWDLELFHTLAFSSMQCIPCSLELHEWSRSSFNFSLEIAVISGEFPEFPKCWWFQMNILKQPWEILI